MTEKKNAPQNSDEVKKLRRLIAAADRYRNLAVSNADYVEGCRFRDLAETLRNRIKQLTSPKKETGELRAWGVPFNSGMTQSQTGDGSCPSFTCQTKHGTKYYSPLDYWQIIIGFTPNAPDTKSERQNVIGILIAECPGCFVRYWFHATVRDVDIGKQVHKWPKD